MAFPEDFLSFRRCIECSSIPMTKYTYNKLNAPQRQPQSHSARFQTGEGKRKPETTSFNDTAILRYDIITLYRIGMILSTRVTLCLCAALKF